jgi:predicted PurR-regulated permease PerM
MILPFIVGIFAAYMCIPLLKSITRIGVPRPAGILILFGAFFLTFVVIVNLVGSIIPDKKEQLVLRTRFQYKLNERYQDFMGLEKPEDTGNMIYKYFGNDFDRFMKSINDVLRLDKEERRLFVKYREGYRNEPPVKELYYQYFLKNTESTKNDDEDAGPEAKNGKKSETRKESHFGSVMAAVKLWIIMPLVFLFLLIDDGEIKRFFIGLVPNRYFEVSLAVFDKVNKAIGNYLRGILIECSLVGIAYLILLLLIGFEIKMAVMIGLIAGIANAVPLLGPAIAFGIGASYALIAEDVSSILPFITADNLFIAVAACVVIVMILDNAVFQPFVVGGAVQIHPLVVFIGIIGGSMLFGFAGLILAIPTIVVVKELTATLFRELKEYYII